MPETVLFEFEADRSRDEIAAYLRTVADKLDGGGEITLEAGGESVSLTPPDTAEFEVKAEREGPADGPGELSIELEIEWPEDADDESRQGDGELTIE